MEPSVELTIKDLNDLKHRSTPEQVATLNDAIELLATLSKRNLELTKILDQLRMRVIMDS